MAIVLYHEEMGVYLGSCFGLSFWSKLDPIGQEAAITFKDSIQAAETMKHWVNIPEDVRAVPVNSIDKHGYASIDACVKAGLPAWEPDPSKHLQYHGHNDLTITKKESEY
jgi:hypothetical protein